MTFTTSMIASYNAQSPSTGVTRWSLGDGYLFEARLNMTELANAYGPWVSVTLVHPENTPYVRIDLMQYVRMIGRETSMGCGYGYGAATTETTTFNNGLASNAVASRILATFGIDIRTGWHTFGLKTKDSTLRWTIDGTVVLTDSSPPAALMTTPLAVRIGMEYDAPPSIWGSSQIVEEYSVPVNAAVARLAGFRVLALVDPPDPGPPVFTVPQACSLGSVAYLDAPAAISVPDVVQLVGLYRADIASASSSSIVRFLYRLFYG